MKLVFSSKLLGSIAPGFTEDVDKVGSGRLNELKGLSAMLFYGGFCGGFCGGER